MNFVQIIFSEVRYHRFDFRFDCEYTSHTRNTKDNFLLQAIISRRIHILNTLNATCVITTCVNYVKLYVNLHDRINYTLTYSGC